MVFLSYYIQFLTTLEISSMRPQGTRPDLHPKCTPTGDTRHIDPKQLFRNDIGKSLTRFKEDDSLQKQFKFDARKNSQFSRYDQRKGKSYGREFFVNVNKGRHHYREPPYNNKTKQKIKLASKEVNNPVD